MCVLIERMCTSAPHGLFPPAPHLPAATVLPTVLPSHPLSLPLPTHTAPPQVSPDMQRLLHAGKDKDSAIYR